MTAIARNGGFCGALQRAPPPMPSGISRRLANNDIHGIGKVKVMLRLADNYTDTETPHFLRVDKKKRQVTLTDPVAQTSASTTSQDRRPMIASPKMFVFDNLFTMDDQQHDVCASALSELIPAVLKGSDGCLLSIGYPFSGQGKTMLGDVSASNELGAIPSAISWLYKGINEQRQKSGSRFSVRVSALGVSAIKPDCVAKDLLAAHASESDVSPGIYLRDDFLGGATELRAPSAERAALFLDTALSGRLQGALEPAIIFTLHVYQYSLSRKGGVAGGRSHLHLIDLGGCANRNGGLSLISIGNILLAILSGQRHPPNRDHPLTPLLKDCLSPMNCHVAVVAHVSHNQSHTDALTTIQLASRIHRMRRRKHRFAMPSGRGVNSKLGDIMNGEHKTAESKPASGADLSSSELSADTVIYLGPSDEATDGEHPPVYLPSFREDSRNLMDKMLKPSGLAKQAKLVTKIPGTAHEAPSSPLLTHKPQVSSPAHSQKKLAHTKVSSPKSGSNSSFRRYKEPSQRRQESTNMCMPKMLDEQWIDGPRVSRAKVAEARYLLREVNHEKQAETWVDGPKLESSSSLTTKNLTTACSQLKGYGFMDSEKKSMIRQWVETQTSQVVKISGTVSAVTSPTHNSHKKDQRNMSVPMLEFNQNPATEASYQLEHLQYLEKELNSIEKITYDEPHDNSIELDRVSPTGANKDIDEDPDSGPSEVPPALPLIEPLGPNVISQETFHRIITRHISRESLFKKQKQLENDEQKFIGSRHSSPHHYSCKSINMSDCGTQVTEEDIALSIAGEHPLSGLSHCGHLSRVSSSFLDAECKIEELSSNQFDQLARLHNLFTSQLAMAEVTPVFRNGCDVESVYSEPAYLFNTFPGSVCSESPYRAASPVNSSQASFHCSKGRNQIADMMKPLASIRQPDGASDQNLTKIEKPFKLEQKDSTEDENQIALKVIPEPLIPDIVNTKSHKVSDSFPRALKTQLPLLPLNASSEAYDSGHDSSTPRTSKHSGISRRAESGYHSVATARDSDESSLISGLSKSQHNHIFLPQKQKKRQDKGLCNWLMNPFTCTYPETEGEISDF